MVESFLYQNKLRKWIMKKIFAFILTFVMLFSFVSCVGDGEMITYSLDDILSGGPYSSFNYMKKDLSRYVEVGEYFGLTVDIDDGAIITDVDVDNIIFEIADSLTTYEPYEIVVKDRATEAGDFVNIDYVGYIDGEEFEGGKNTGDSIVLADYNGFLDWFDDDLYGVMPGTTVETVGVFPNNYSAELAGKEVTFKITVNYIAGHYTIPVIDDALISANTEFKTLSEYREAIREELQAQADSEYDIEKVNSVWQMILESAEIKKLPKQQVGYYYTSERSLYEEYAATYGYTYEGILKELDLTDEDILEYVEERVIEECVFYSIVKAENVQITDAEYQKGIKDYAAYEGVTEQELVNEYGEEYIKEAVLWDKVMTLLKNNTIYK